VIVVNRFEQRCEFIFRLGQVDVGAGIQQDLCGFDGALARGE